MEIIIIAIVYVVGFFATLLTLHKTDGFWGEWNCYDPPHDGWYDDYSSNAQAYLSFSFIWPLFIVANLVKAGWGQLERLSKYLGKNS